MTVFMRFDYSAVFESGTRNFHRMELRSIRWCKFLAQVSWACVTPFTKWINEWSPCDWSSSRLTSVSLAVALFIRLELTLGQATAAFGRSKSNRRSQECIGGGQRPRGSAGLLGRGTEPAPHQLGFWGSGVNSPVGLEAEQRPQMHFGRAKSPENFYGALEMCFNLTLTFRKHVWPQMSFISLYSIRFGFRKR